MSLRQLPSLQCATALAAEEFSVSVDVATAWNPALEARAAEGDNTISILQPVGESLFMDGFTAQRMSAALRSIGDRDVVVNINSPGGLITEGTAIYNMLRQHKGKVTVRILGVAASIASIIAMAGDTIEIAKTATMFVHNSEVPAIGNRHVHAEAVENLATFDEMMASVYAERSGLTAREVEKLMDGRNNNGTMMSSTFAIDKGFADALLPADATKVKVGAKADISPIRRLEELATTGAQASRADFKRLIKEFKAGIAGRETGMPGAAEDTMPGAGVNEGLLAALAQIDIPLIAKG